VEGTEGKNKEKMKRRGHKNESNRERTNPPTFLTLFNSTEPVT
jgi:hypothetical protein